MKAIRFRSGVVIAVIREASEEGNKFSRQDKLSSAFMYFPNPHALVELRKFIDQNKDLIRSVKLVCSSSLESSCRQLISEANIELVALKSIEEVSGSEREIQFLPDRETLRIEKVQQRQITPVQSDQKIRVLVVDDSRSMRSILVQMLKKSSRIEVVADVDRPSKALEFLAQSKNTDKFPHVTTLDIQLPEMSGVDLLKKISNLYEINSVMISALGLNEGREVMDALEAGAFDYIQKPEASEIAATQAILVEKVLAAGSKTIKSKKRDLHGQRRYVDSSSLGTVSFSSKSTELIVIGASTGGTEAIRRLLARLSGELPPILIVQHIPPLFSAAFADRLNNNCKFEVREAKDGDLLKPNLALVAPGGLHMAVAKGAKGLSVKVFDGEAVNRFKPSVDVLFSSVAREVGSRATGIILTGMGNDGAKGLLEMKNSGARTIGQDEETCVVYGMPKAAFEIGAVSEVSPLDEIALLLSKRRGDAA